jgi:AcrR family transcriptional regulator
MQPLDRVDGHRIGGMQTRREDRSKGSYDAETVARAAFELFLRHGYNVTSLDQIAAALNVSKAAIYYHHAGKEAILSYGVNQALGALEGVLQEAPALRGQASPLQRFEYVLRRTLEIGMSHLPQVAVLLRLQGNTDLERDVIKRRRAIDRAAADILEEAIAAGELPEHSDALLLSRLTMGLANSLVEWYRPDNRRSTAEVVETTLRFAMSGLRRGAF